MPQTYEIHIDRRNKRVPRYIVRIPGAHKASCTFDIRAGLAHAFLWCANRANHIVLVDKEGRVKQEWWVTTKVRPLGIKPEPGTVKSATPSPPKESQC